MPSSALAMQAVAECLSGGPGAVSPIEDDNAFRCGHVWQSADDVCLIIKRRLADGYDVDCLAVSPARFVQ
jgi:hypothetical protein